MFQSIRNLVIKLVVIAVAAIIPAVVIGLVIPSLIDFGQAIVASPSQMPENFFSNNLYRWMGAVAYPIAFVFVLILAWYFTGGNKTDAAGTRNRTVLLIAVLVVFCIGSTVLLANPLVTFSDNSPAQQYFLTSPVYTQAMQAAQTDSRATELFGSPIQNTGSIRGSISEQGVSGDADLVIPIAGPRAKGFLFASARRGNGKWNFYSLAVQVNGSTDAIVLTPP